MHPFCRWCLKRPPDKGDRQWGPFRRFGLSEIKKVNYFEMKINAGIERRNKQNFNFWQNVWSKFFVCFVHRVLSATYKNYRVQDRRSSCPFNRLTSSYPSTDKYFIQIVSHLCTIVHPIIMGWRINSLNLVYHSFLLE